MIKYCISYFCGSYNDAWASASDFSAFQEWLYFGPLVVKSIGIKKYHIASFCHVFVWYMGNFRNEMTQIYKQIWLDALINFIILFFSSV